MEIERYVSEILNGFENTINYLSNNKNDFLNLIRQSIKKSDTFRVVLRHTTVYSKYLGAALHPDYLSSNGEREKLFQRLLVNCSDEAERSRVNDEIKTLKTGDVPYFKFCFDSKALYSNNGLIRENYFLFTAKDIIINRIKTIDENLKANLDLISKSLSTDLVNKSKQGDILKYNFNRKASNEEIVIQVADGILERTFYQKDEDAALYYINYIYDDRIYFEPVNVNLYEGGGLILYLAAVSKLTGNRKYFGVADKLLSTATMLAEFKKRRSDASSVLSAFSGDGSLVYLNY